jgi:hypothetical protein
MKSGGEYDALTRAGRKVHRFNSRWRKHVKRKFRRRERAELKQQVKCDDSDGGV